MKWAIFVFIRVIYVRKKWIPDVLLHMLQLQHMFPFLPKAMLFTSKSIAPRLQEHCFRSPGALLLEPKSIVLAVWKHCYWSLGVMLLEVKSIAFGRNGNKCSKCSMCSRTYVTHFFRTRITRINTKIAHFIGNYDALLPFFSMCQNGRNQNC